MHSLTLDPAAPLKYWKFHGNSFCICDVWYWFAWLYNYTFASFLFSFFFYFRIVINFRVQWTTIWANSADDKLTIVFLYIYLFIYLFIIFSGKRFQHFMHTVSLGKISTKCQNIFSRRYRQFVWNVIAFFLDKIRKIFQNVVCWHFCPASSALTHPKRVIGKQCRPRSDAAKLILIT